MVQEDQMLDSKIHLLEEKVKDLILDNEELRT